MISQEFLDLLRCPETKQKLITAEADTLRDLNGKIARGVVKNRGGQLLVEPVAEGLIREDGAFLYPVRDGLPIMLVDEALPLR